MFIKKLILTTLAVASVAVAQKQCQADNNEINSQADVEAISNCNTLEGDLTIGEDLTMLELPNLQQIKGDFIATSASELVSIDMDKLRSIGGEFRLQELTSLTTLKCPSLTRVGDITWITLPKLIALNFDAQVTEAKNVRISDTQLNSLQGINLRTAVRFNIDNNKYLKTVSVGLTNVSEALSLEFNSKQIQVAFPNLVWANNITLIDANSVSLPSLKHVNGSMNFGNNSLTSIVCKNLTEVEQTLAFSGNTKLTELDFPQLVTIGGGFKIHNNTELTTIDGFPKLETVRGAVDFVGNFNNATLPSLEDVQGGFNLQTTEDFDCSEFEEYESQQVIKGDDFVCKGSEEDPQTKDGASGAGSGSGNDDDENAAGRVTISALLGLSVAVIGFSL